MHRLIREVWSNFKEYIVLIFLLIISLLLIPFNEHAATRKIRTIFFSSFSVVTSVYDDYLKVSNVKGENEFLRKRNAELVLEVSRLREYAFLNDQLKNMLSLKDTFNYKLFPAAIISKSFSTSQNTFTINLGLKDSIKTGMPVLTGEGFVGIVYSVSDDFSIVRNINNSNLKVIVKVERSGFKGILRWNGSYLTVTNLPKTADIEIGDRIVTSELSSIVSLPIPVGLAKEVLNPEKGYFNDLIIQPYVDMASVEYVFVLGLLQSKIKHNIELNFFRNN